MKEVQSVIRRELFAQIEQIASETRDIDTAAEYFLQDLQAAIDYNKRFRDLILNVVVENIDVDEIMGEYCDG